MYPLLEKLEIFCTFKKIFHLIDFLRVQMTKISL